MVMRNHEGYYDPTAAEAIRRAEKRKWRRGGEIPPLTYRLSEVPGFPNKLG